MSRHFNKDRVVNKNLLINGGFDIWQRGDSFPSIVSGITADRWVASTGDASGGAVSVSKVALTTDNTWMGTNVKNVLRFTATGIAGGTEGALLYQNIENVGLSNNKNFTLSFVIQNDNAPFTLNVSPVQNMGTGGAPSSSYVGGSQSLTIPTGLSRQVVALSFPSLAGKTLGTNNDHRFLALFSLPANTDGDFFIGAIQLEQGSAATTFDHRPIAEELALCKRYYEHIEGLFFLTPYTAGSTGGEQVVTWVFAVTKRAPPTVTYSQAVINNSADTDKVRAQLSTPASANTATYIDMIADAEL